MKGLKEKIRPPELFKGSSYDNKEFKRPPCDLSEALDYFKNSELIKEAFNQNEVEFLTRFYENEIVVKNDGIFWYSNII